MLASLRTSQVDAASVHGPARFSETLFGWADRPIALPAWAQFYVDLGASVETAGNTRRWTAIAAPTRGFAAALVAIGRVLRRVTDSHGSESVAVESDIRGLRVGTPLFYFPSPVCKWEGEFAGVVTTTSEFAMIRIRDRDELPDSRTICVPADRWNRIVVPDSSFPVERLRGSARRLPLTGLLAGLPNANCVAESAHVGRPVSHIVGNIRSLRREVCEVPFSTSNGTRQFTGTLNDVLRVRRWSKPDDGLLTEVLPTRDIPADLPSNVPLAIYDGASAFLRYCDLWQPAHSVVILDRTEHHFDNAAAEVNRLLVSGSRLHLPPGINPPKSLEIATFEVRS